MRVAFMTKDFQGLSTVSRLLHFGITSNDLKHKPETSRDLGRGRSMLTAILAPIKLVVLALEVKASRNSEHDGQTCGSDIDSEGLDVSRAVAIQIAAPDVGCVADGVDEGDCAGSLGRRLGQRGCDPRQSYDSGGVEGGWEKHHGDVAGGNVERRDGNDIGCECEEEGPDDVEEALASAV